MLLKYVAKLGSSMLKPSFVFIIGGGKIFKQSLASDVHRCYARYLIWKKYIE